jgi:hypothetical protein
LPPKDLVEQIDKENAANRSDIENSSEVVNYELIVEPTAPPTEESLKEVTNKKRKKTRRRKKKKSDETTGPTLAPTPINWGEKHIALIPGPKKGVRQDMRVVIPVDLDKQANLGDVVKVNRADPTNILGQSRPLLEAQEILKGHPLLAMSPGDKSTLESAIVNLKASPQCAQMPIYLTMATVGDDLYWQLIENFVYTMVKFNSSSCSLVICVNDPRCMSMCADSYFPCYEYQHTQPVSRRCIVCV